MEHSKVADRSDEVARGIRVAKVTVLILNWVGSAVFIIVGVNAHQADASNVLVNLVPTLLVWFGIVGLVAGTLLVWIAFGWFELMLRGMAELLRFNSAGPVINVAPQAGPTWKPGTPTPAFREDRDWERPKPGRG